MAAVMNFDVFAMQNTRLHDKMPIEAGIRIYEICDSTESNPKPEDEIDMTLGEFITHQKLVSCNFIKFSAKFGTIFISLTLHVLHFTSLNFYVFV